MLYFLYAGPRQKRDGCERLQKKCIAAGQAEKEGEVPDANTAPASAASATAQGSAAAPGSVFISYARHDQHRVLPLVNRMRESGIDAWLDQERIAGGASYGPRIVEGIRSARAFVLMCSDASMRSREVKQEIQLAWRYQRTMLPLLLDRISFPEQIEYWTTGWQWIEVLDQADGPWLPALLRALAEVDAGETLVPGLGMSGAGFHAQPKPIAAGLEGLRSVAAFTDQIWPVRADASGPEAPTTRGLGAPQTGVQHGHRLGSRVRLAIESDRERHLLLLDEGPEGIPYCLCPSQFAPATRIPRGRSYLPQPGAPHNAFLVTGAPGREQLLAILTEEPLPLKWMPSDPLVPARVLSGGDVDQLLAALHALEGDRWTALSTYFDIIAGDPGASSTRRAS